MSIQNTHFGNEKIRDILSNSKSKSIFFVGIGGINMSSLAHISHSMGMRVGGSDRSVSALTEKLSARGIEIFYSHSAEHIEGYDVLVYTVAISEDNPEYLRAREKGIPCISRADYMGFLMSRYKRRIGISGMHGKSTCTSMCAQTLLQANTDPTVLSGAELPMMDGAYCVGHSDEYFLFEACEYMDSFLDFYPNIAVILNLEMDHVDYFKSLEQIRASFCRFANIAAEGLSGDRQGEGVCVANGDDKELRTALEGYRGRLVWFGLDSSCDICADNIVLNKGCYGFDVLSRGERLCHIQLSLAGYHNIYNALAAFAAMRSAGLETGDIVRGIEAFHGASRRMEYRGSLNGCALYDDYGHHPTEVRATIRAARDIAEGRVICLFQSHTYSRTAALQEDFVNALREADAVIITDIYAARETDTLGVTIEGIAQSIGQKAVARHGMCEAADELKRIVQKGDVALVMGAGDIFKVFEHLELDTR